MGRRKIEIKKLEDKAKKNVTFSKRRKGLFKKAADTCKMYDAEIAIIVFSPAGHPFTFGHSSVDTVIDRYLDPVVKKQELQEHKSSVNWWESINVDQYDSLEELERLQSELEKLREKALKRMEVDALNVDDYEVDDVSLILCNDSTGACIGDHDEGGSSSTSIMSSSSSSSNNEEDVLNYFYLDNVFPSLDSCFIGDERGSSSTSIASSSSNNEEDVLNYFSLDDVFPSLDSCFFRDGGGSSSTTSIMSSSSEGGEDVLNYWKAFL